MARLTQRDPCAIAAALIFIAVAAPPNIYSYKDGQGAIRHAQAKLRSRTLYLGLIETARAGVTHNDTEKVPLLAGS